MQMPFFFTAGTFLMFPFQVGNIDGERWIAMILISTTKTTRITFTTTTEGTFLESLCRQKIKLM